MNNKNFNEFKEFLIKTDEVTYEINQDFSHSCFKDIKIDDLYSRDSNNSWIEKLQSYLGNDVILFLYDNPGRDNGNFYIHNHEINYDLILGEVKNEPEEYKMIIFRTEHDGYNKEIKAIKNQVPGTVYINLTCPIFNL